MAGAPVASVTANTPKKSYTIAVIPGNGVGQEVIPISVEALRKVGSLEGFDLSFEELPIGGVALDLVGVPLPEETLTKAKQSDAVLLGAVGWPKYDDNPKPMKPITALFQLRAALGVFSNLRPVRVFPHLVDSTYLRKDTSLGVDLLIIRELTGGIYNAHPRGFTTNEQGDEVGFCTELYSATEVSCIHLFQGL
ncbi:unnamed protein product [Microthlaspi erraticum]|uniref:Isopropylmalate dehydrogenase-like domain-containing protein n=1 Tax=Microthlaspi erraticum TaxID=1685480 RepID=A0A6D2JIV6_9BRAS|nr:unnamed protein product [Microthlaspi erraticum]